MWTDSRATQQHDPPARKHAFPAPPSARWQILDCFEAAEESVGLVLWQAVRHVRDWAEERESRSELFRPEPTPEVQAKRALALANAPELTRSLEVFARLTSAPLLTDERSVAAACAEVATWAESLALNETALQFAEAAAAVEPHNPEWANLTGRMARKLTEWARADQWYERAIGLARQSRNRREWFYAHLGAGTTAYSQGRHEDARPHFLAVAWKARDAGRRAEAAKAQHDLMLITAELGELSAAERHSRRALAWYPKHHARFPYFAHDFAYLLVLIGEFDAAVALLGKVLRIVTAPHEQLLVWGTYARAVAGAADWSSFDAAQGRVEDLAAKYPEHAAPALVNVAEGARLRGDVESAHCLATLAHEIAAGQGAGEPQRVAAALLRSLATGQDLPLTENRSRQVRFSVRYLVDETTRRLDRWRGRTWRPRRSA
jgi:tetratricopeptide (TPR) repeat protein